MLAVITFLAIAFLVLTRREKGAVATTTDQLIARNAADIATERALAELLAPILAWTNEFNYDLRVSTNFLNRLGFHAGLQPLRQIDRATLYYATNVSYTYPNGQPVLPGSADFAQVVANLYYDPRPPVFVRTNRDPAAPAEFRFYLDLNRNGRHDANGWLPVVGPTGALLTGPNGIISNFFVGDPEWVGVLERPDFPHSATNRFTARWAYLAVPAGKTLDLNTVHNQAKMLNPTTDGFLRNMGLGPWEINLAAFLVDLNTNFWQGPNAFATPYFYVTNRALQSRGAAFEDAASLVRYRYNSSYNNLRSASQLFFGPGTLAFSTDGLDQYADGPLMTGTSLPWPDNDSARLNFGWSGAENPNHFFTPQDLFDKAKTSPLQPDRFGFTDRLTNASASVSSYDRYTFYRLLSQLGTDSEPEPPGKMNLNYDNLVQRHPLTGSASATNFYAWRPLDFFSNAVERLVRRYSEEWWAADPAGFQRTFGVLQPFGATNIPVLVSNRLAYGASLHRLLQLAANLYDATTPPADAAAVLPTVFRPLFRKEGTNVFIAGFREVLVPTTEDLARPRDLRDPAELAALQPTDNVYGVPWIIGAKKGLPNFNEFAMQSVFQITRKLQIHRDSLAAPRATWQTNQMYILGLSNVLGVEVWNSYRSNYTRPVDILVADDLTLALTNDYGIRLLTRTNVTAALSLPKPGTNVWPGTGLGSAPDERSLLVPLRANFVFLPDAVYLQNARMLTTNLYVPFERGTGFPLPRWGLSVTNRLRVVLLDRPTGRVIDYVQLSGLDEIRDLTGEASRSDGTPGWGSLWDTNRVGARTVNDPTRGIIYQIEVSLGNYNAGDVDWSNFGFNQPSGPIKHLEIDTFRALFGLSPLFGHRVANTNLNQQVPFTPSRKISRYHTWQANDPLVHYLASDLSYLAITNDVRYESLKTPVQTLENLGRLNNRYQPWGGNPRQATDRNAYNLALKDPLMRRSDDWDFPTNKFPNIGWLGRVHRGTPWQTVYLKASDIVAADLNSWQHWIGNPDPADARRLAPRDDRLLFDLFTTSVGDASSRGRLSINQSGLAAWSAVLSGVLVLTNDLTDADLSKLQYAIPPRPPRYGPLAVPPAGAYPPGDTNLWPPLVRIVTAINDVRATNFAGAFRHLGDILAVPELTEQSPFLNQSTALQRQQGLSDAAYERLPQQVLSLLTLGTPRFVVYGYGQTLRPANNSLITAGPFLGLCTTITRSWRKPPRAPWCASKARPANRAP